MDLNGANGYLSRFEGIEVDDAVERVQGLDAELALKVDKSTTINGKSFEDGDIILSAEDIGALPTTTKYGSKLTWGKNENNLEGILSLVDQQGRVLNSVVINIEKSRWGLIEGTLTDQIDLRDALNSKQPMITSSAMLSADLVNDTTATHKFATAAQLTQIATNKGNITTNTNNISTINGKIPAAASTSNQLADKNFVNSSIATNTANFIGTFNSLAELEAYSGTVTNNDYAFVVSTDTAGNVVYKRYKYNGSTSSWVFEYDLNNSSFTADQWAAINSGATTTNVGQITTNKNDISTINNTLSTFGDVVTHDASDFATAAQGQLADTALQSINSTMVTAALGFTPYNATNPAGYISSAAISSLTDVSLTNLANGQILKYNDTSNKWENAAFSIPTSLDNLTDVTITSPAQGQGLTYDATSGKWKNTTATATVAWGGITGTLSDQTDLQDALDSKSGVTIVDWE